MGKLNEGRPDLSPSVGKSELMWDPCVTRGLDDTDRSVWTSRWNENNIGHASSKDVIR